jgi:hypothetical protein
VRRLLLAVDGAILLGLGAYMLLLSSADAYSGLLNPKFRALTAAAAAGLCTAAAAFLIRPTGGPDGLRTLGFAVLGALVWVGTGGSGPASSPGLTLRPPESRPAPAPHLSRDGRLFLKSNPVRLFFLMQTEDGLKPGERFATRGVVRRSAQLDRSGRFAVMRVNMVCCLADAVAMGVMVEAGGLPPVADGEWVAVFGRMRRLPEPEPVADAARPGGTAWALIGDRAVLVAEALERIDPPRFPYVFEQPSAAGGPPRLTGEDVDY